jgi:hypothetical protein
VTGRVPKGISGSCFLALLALGGEATTTEIRLHLKQQDAALTTTQVRTCLHSLTRIRKTPLVELARRGDAGYGKPGLWRVTRAGRETAARAAGQREDCGTGWPS